MIRLIVAGSRTIDDYSFIEDQILMFLEPIIHPDDVDDLEIVSGHAKGVDTAGELWAIGEGYKVKYFPAQWEVYGGQAGFIRNREMANYATHCLIITENESSGSQNMYENAQRVGLKTTVVHYVRK